jgi:hypothetical protein
MEEKNMPKSLVAIIIEDKNKEYVKKGMVRIADVEYHISKWAFEWQDSENDLNSEGYVGGFTPAKGYIDRNAEWIATIRATKVMSRIFGHDTYRIELFNYTDVAFFAGVPTFSSGGYKKKKVESIVLEYALKIAKNIRENGGDAYIIHDYGNNPFIECSRNENSPFAYPLTYKEFKEKQV